MSFHPPHYRQPIPTHPPTSFPWSSYKLTYSDSSSAPSFSRSGSVRSTSSLSSFSSLSSYPSTMTFPSSGRSSISSVSSRTSNYSSAPTLSTSLSRSGGTISSHSSRLSISSLSSMTPPPSYPSSSIQSLRVGAAQMPTKTSSFAGDYYTKSLSGSTITSSSSLTPTHRSKSFSPSFSIPISTPAVAMGSHGLYLARSTAAEAEANDQRSKHFGVGVSQAIDQQLATKRADYAKTSLYTNTGALIGSSFGLIGTAVGAAAGFTVGRLSEGTTTPPTTAFDRNGPINVLQK